MRRIERKGCENLGEKISFHTDVDRPCIKRGRDKTRRKQNALKVADTWAETDRDIGGRSTEAVYRAAPRKIFQWKGKLGEMFEFKVVKQVW